jgi:thiol-disulfide isomerase/thioredoxin
MDVLELDQATFHTFLRNTSDRVVVVDFFTNWCAAGIAA